VTFGDRWTYRFDLAGCTQARFALDVGANGGKAWHLEGSSDGQAFETLRSGQSWPTRQVLLLPDRYVGKPFWLRIRGDNCMLNACTLDLTQHAETSFAADEWQ